MRFARKVEFTLQSGKENEFKKVFQADVLEILQKQKGFQDEVVLTNGRQATAISLWDSRADAEAYDKANYAKVLTELRPVIEGTPKVEACEVPFTTLHAAV